MVHSRSKSASGSVGNRCTVGRPLVAEAASAQAVEVVDAVRVGSERRPVFANPNISRCVRIARDVNVACGKILKIDNRGCGDAGLASFNHAVAVHVAAHHGDALADLSFAQHKRAAGGSGDVHAVRFPLIAEGAQAVAIGEIVAGCQGVALSRSRDVDGGIADQGVVGNDYQVGGAAEHTFVSAVAVGVFGNHGDGLANFA